MKELYEILVHYGMPVENINAAVEQIIKKYGANCYLDGVIDGATWELSKNTKTR